MNNRLIKHCFIPDPQISSGVPVNHILACARYIVDQLPDVIVIIGDWWDMPSLSSYEKKGSKYFHDKNYRNKLFVASSTFTSS